MVVQVLDYTVGEEARGSAALEVWRVDRFVIGLEGSKDSRRQPAQPNRQILPFPAIFDFQISIQAAARP